MNTICDLKCKYCFYTIGHEKRSAKRITVKDIPTLVQAIVDLGFTCVILTGGDPLCSKFKSDTYYLISLLKKNAIKVIVNTSAVKLDMHDVETIISLQIDRIDITVNSYKKDIHDYERGLFDDTIWSIKTLLAKGYYNVFTTTVISEYNAPYARQTLEWLLSIGVKDVYYQPVFTTAKSQNYFIIEKALEECSKVTKRPYTNLYLEQCSAAYSGLTQLNNSDCRMGANCLICDAYGNLYPCFHRQDFKLGNIYSDTKSLITARIEDWKQTKKPKMPCFGKHCVSLFDGKSCWKEIL